MQQVSAQPINRHYRFISRKVSHIESSFSFLGASNAAEKPRVFYENTIFNSRKHAYELFAIVVLLFFVINNTELPTNLQQIIT